MQVLVTGGAGFVGSHLVDHLLEDEQIKVVVLDDFTTGVKSNLEHITIDRVTIEQVDVRNADIVTPYVEEADEVYHLAAAVGVKKIVERPLESLKTNLDATENVLQAASSDGTPVFLASSSEIYGRAGEEPLSENHDRILGPVTTTRWSYATAKAADEFMALGYHDQHNLPVVIGRFFNIVGPRQTGQYGMVVPRFVAQALAGDTITVYGDGTQSRSFSHVQDTVEIIVELMQTPEAIGEVFNIGAPSPTTINELADRVIELIGSNSDITHIPFEEVYGPDFEEPSHRIPDVSKLRDTLGRVPEDDLDRILTDVIEEAKSNREVHPDV